MPRTIFCIAMLALSAFAEEPAAPFQDPQGPLTLRDAIAITLEHSPELAVFPWDQRIADARIVQAGLRPNPELSLELENLGIGDGDGSSVTTRSLGIGREGLSASWERERESGTGAFSDTELTLSLSHTIELGGKRAARIAAAEKSRDVASWNYEVARAEVAGEVLVRFAEILAAQERLLQQEPVVKLAEDLASSVHALVEAGSVSPLEARRADAELERSRIQRRELSRAVEQARLRLAALWGSSVAQFTEAVGDLAVTASLPTLQCIQELRAEHPALGRWGAELASRESLLTLERKQRVPDLTLRLGYRGTAEDSPPGKGFAIGTEGISASRISADDDTWRNSVVLEASIPLPLFHRNQGAIREAELMVDRLGAEQRGWEKALEAALAEQHGVATAALEKQAAFSARVVPEMETTLSLTREGYERGKFDFLRVLDAQRAVIDARLEVLDARVAYHLAVAEIERLLGAGLSEIVEMTDAPQSGEQTEGNNP